MKLYQIVLWMLCIILSGLNADQTNGNQTRSCGTFSLITSCCKESDVILRFEPKEDHTVTKATWTLDHFRYESDRWVARNDTGIYIYVNDSRHYLVWRTREKNRPTVYFLITVDSEPPCNGAFGYILVQYDQFIVCKEMSSPQVRKTTAIYTSRTSEKINYWTNATKVVTPTANTNSRFNVITKTQETVTKKKHLSTSQSTGTWPVEKNAKTWEENDRDKITNEPNTGSKSGTDKEITKTKDTEGSEDPTLDQKTIGSMKANTVDKNESYILTVVLATLGGLICAVVLVIVVFVHRTKKGNQPQDENDNGNLQEDAQRERSVRNGYECVSQDTPEVLYAQVEKKHKTLQNASLVAQAHVDETDRRDANVKPIKKVLHNQTVKPNDEEAATDTNTNKSTAVPNNEDTKQELVYIQLDMDHLNKSSTLLRKSAERNDEDKTEYVGIDFAKTSQNKAN